MSKDLYDNLRDKLSKFGFLSVEEKNILRGLFMEGCRHAISKLYQVHDNSLGQEFYSLWQEYAKYPRYKACYLKAANQIWHIPDALSFLYQYKEIFLDRIYEFRPKTRENLHIIDMGINVGTSMKFFHDAYPNAYIEGFEADPGIFQYCKENLKDILLEDRMSIHNLAVWDSEGSVDFFNEGADGGRIAMGNNLPHAISVPTVDAKSLLSHYEQVDFLKMDIEGAETQVLRRIESELPKVDNIFVEYHSMVDTAQTIDELFSILRNAGFRLYLDSNPLSRQPFMTYPNSNGFDVQVNVFGVREV